MSRGFYGGAGGFFSLREQRPLVHCIVGSVSQNLCANALLALGARPIMAAAPEEAAEIAARADSLFLSLACLPRGAEEVLLPAGLAAKKKGISVVFDAVGAGLSAYRGQLSRAVIEQVRPAVLKGNASEIRFLVTERHHASGVDASPMDAPDEEFLKEAAAYAGKRGTVLLLTGKTDYILSGEGGFSVAGGHEALSRTTGTGCMVGALTAAYASGNAPTPAALLGALSAKLAGGGAGERFSDRPGGLPAELLDELYALTEEKLMNGGDAHVQKIL